MAKTPCSSAQVDGGRQSDISITTDAPLYLVVPIILNSLALKCIDVNSLKNTILCKRDKIGIKK